MNALRASFLLGLLGLPFAHDSAGDGTATGNMYLAGLWREDLPRALLWSGQASI